jgi:hypothetical protein
MGLGSVFVIHHLWIARHTGIKFAILDAYTQIVISNHLGFGGDYSAIRFVRDDSVAAPQDRHWSKS